MLGRLGREGGFVFGRVAWQNIGRLREISLWAFSAHESLFETSLARPYVAPRRLSRCCLPHSSRKDTGGHKQGGCGGWCLWVREKTSLPDDMDIPMDVIALSARTISNTNSYVENPLK